MLIGAICIFLSWQRGLRSRSRLALGRRAPKRLHTRSVSEEQLRGRYDAIVALAVGCVFSEMGAARV